ncbi:nonsense-mediated mRNA decay factor SMG7 [Prosopis cineraria]|uniref:nonsense-mediated mRNA decay factor SMG7 n=1 Tax=Prosopis cineraria TaxID=364024 RepID=UPI002410403F|nr:nonsense-mediated mRNA decay factor SMG7 [Prosopis cineraria]XP_054797756.1 nonsense-mediated mRNA decay factor SMG7 [Prosopis cineraria]XP_054797757.1 nonsense-mediated mRNA decay factor SMG7 [Prosopis cineraria]XP_054797759.1 nonsense-mediated mRNA decay factor SMG7 [Prosopis cineraria]XP_054797760.1 nonsense-mediated mRNA decay factor SMG7 [Prosopis cineraria]XP_054797761.1 nonsense-mediated mRNA decay factor SMG7 [Prosopis cineraria]XP_054797762.1 nonsense-mediated mRNA decay factor SM
MMIVQMDKMSAPSSRERAQRLYEKNLELENKRRRSAQARVPSDPNAWQQMRENYEAIIIEDHTFAEQHNIEYALWQLHYKRIEELRAYFSAALSSTSPNSTHGIKGPARPDRITKIRLQFKTFLSEATGFYHDLIMKIRAKYGLPLGHFEDSENRIVMEKDGKKSAEMKKGLISCHRCLIYLGDLARYKGLYGEGDSVNREFAAASSYYLQAASFSPSNGNPQHQLALLASYSGDELVTIYRYFRSLAVESPFTTARENLIVAFEKNRQSYSQLPGDAKALVAKVSSGRLAGKGRGKVEAKLAAKSVEASPKKEGASNIEERYKNFCTRFVRLNGILFTRTSLETFTEVLSLVSAGLRELLSGGQNDELNFGTDTLENGLAIVRIVSILIFTVHNVNRESEGQTYAEIVQRAVLLQNAFTATFELMGYIVERCVQLHEPSSSYLLPGILIFMEWLASYPDFAAGNDADENQAMVRSKFWINCISFLNKLLSVGPVSIEDDEENTCFNNMSRYEEGETENRLALWEDFELRGFLPLLPAHTILDFSRKHSLGSESDKGRKARVKRIVSAGKALANVVRVNQNMIHFDSRGKKFVIGVEPQKVDDVVIATYSGMPNAEELVQEIVLPNQHQYMEGDEDDEVIVFKPVVAEKPAEVVSSTWAAHGELESVQKASEEDKKFHANTISNPLNNLNHQNAFDANFNMPVSVSGMMPQHLQTVQPHSSRWLEEMSFANSLKGLTFLENGHVMKPDLQEASCTSNYGAFPVPTQHFSACTTALFHGLTNAPESVIPSKVDAVATSGIVIDNMVVNPSTMQAGLSKAVSRPIRHLGPPPGFGALPSNQVKTNVSDSVSGNLLLDDYSWLNGYQLPPSTKGLGSNGPLTYSHSNSQQVLNNNGLGGTVSFPFPGKQVPPVPLDGEKQNIWQDYHTPEPSKIHHNQQLQPHQQFAAGNQQFTPLPEQFQGQSTWTGRYFV